MSDDDALRWPEDDPDPAKTPEPRVEAEDPADTTGRGCAIGCISAIVIFLGVAFLGLLASEFGGGDEPTPVDPYVTAHGVMRSACESAVLGRLKAPTTAKLSGTHGGNDGQRWLFTGAVDAENSFGVPIRSAWSCAGLYSGGLATDVVTLIDGK